MKGQVKGLVKGQVKGLVKGQGGSVKGLGLDLSTEGGLVVGDLRQGVQGMFAVPNRLRMRQRMVYEQIAQSQSTFALWDAGRALTQ